MISNIFNGSYLKSITMTQKIARNEDDDFKSIHKLFKFQLVGWICYYEFEIFSKSFHKYTYNI